MYSLYTDGSILAGLYPKDIGNIITKIKQAKLDIIVERSIGSFFGVNIDSKGDMTIRITQPLLIDSIFEDLNVLVPKVKTKDTPCSFRIIHRQ